MDESVAIRAVHTALTFGNFIDNSSLHGLTRAETVLGKVLRSIPRDRCFVGTKVGRHGDEGFDISAARTKASVEESPGP